MSGDDGLREEELMLDQRLAAVVAHRWMVDGYDSEVDANALVLELTAEVQKILAAEREQLAALRAKAPAAVDRERAEEVHCYCDRDPRGHDWSRDEGCTRRPVTVKPDLWLEAVRYELSGWEVFLDTDGDRSIRRREPRSADEIIAALIPIVTGYARECAAEELRAAAFRIRRDYRGEVSTEIADEIDEAAALVTGGPPVTKETT